MGVAQYFTFAEGKYFTLIGYADQYFIEPVLSSLNTIADAFLLYTFLLFSYFYVKYFR